MSLNNIAAAGAEPIGVMLAVVLPEKTEESELQTMMERAEEVCRLNNVEIIGGHTEVLPAITEPIMTVTGVG
ncbi:hydrogenase maturation factor, partial [Klebsiella oxytoca]